MWWRRAVVAAAVVLVLGASAVAGYSVKVAIDTRAELARVRDRQDENVARMKRVVGAQIKTAQLADAAFRSQRDMLTVLKIMHRRVNLIEGG